MALVLIAVVIALPEAAVAEVCDKIADEKWMTQDGPVIWLTERPNQTFLTFAALGYLACALVAARRGAWSLAAASFVACGLFAVGIWSPGQDSIWLQGVEEGCVGLVKREGVPFRIFLPQAALIMLVYRRDLWAWLMRIASG